MIKLRFKTLRKTLRKIVNIRYNNNYEEIFSLTALRNIKNLFFNKVLMSSLIIY